MLFSVALGEVIILAADLGAIAGVVALALTVISAVSVATIRWWRKRHPLKVLFSLDPYDAGLARFRIVIMRPFGRLGEERKRTH